MRAFIDVCIGILGAIIVGLCWLCYGIFWVLYKSRLLYPVVWFVFSLVVTAHPQWALYPILINGTWTAVLWIGVGAALVIMVIMLGIRDIIRFWKPEFSWGDVLVYIKQRKIARRIKKDEKEYQIIKDRLYELHPHLEFEEFNFKNNICKNDDDCIEFEIDWQTYIYTLNRSVDFIEFSEWYKKNKRWKFTKYNHKYFEEHTQISQKENEKETENKANKVKDESEISKLTKMVEELLHHQTDAEIAQQKNDISEIESSTNVDISSENAEQGAFPYRDYLYKFYLKRDFLDSPIEKKIFPILQKFINGNYVIVPHAALKDIFGWGKWRDNSKLTNKVKDMHFDFVIFEQLADNLFPLLFIEVQGGEHSSDSSTIQRDQFKKDLLNQFNFKLITIDATKTIPDEELEQVVVKNIKDAVPSREDYAIHCPKCKGKMQIKKNHNNREYFYGCTKWRPDKTGCLGRRNISDVPPLYDGIPIEGGGKIGS